MDALLSLATAAEKVEEPRDEKPPAGGAKQYSRKTRPTHTTYQKAVMTRCTQIVHHTGHARAPRSRAPRIARPAADYEYNKLPDAKERAALGQAVGARRIRRPSSLAHAPRSARYPRGSNPNSLSLIHI